MRNLLTFFVEGEPRPKQSFRVSGRGGYQPARVKSWQTDVAVEAQNAMREVGRFNQPYEKQIAVRMIFILGNSRRVDLDNLSKCVLDGLNGIVFNDDMQVSELNLKKTVVDKKSGMRVGVNVFIAGEL